MTFPGWLSQFFNDPNLYAWVTLPIIIFFARVCDVTLGTIRIIMVGRGKRNIAPLLGFCEVFIWIVAIGQLVQHIQSVTAFFGYAAGFAAGNFVGMYIEDKLAMGTVMVRAILNKDGDQVAGLLHQAGFGVTTFEGQGALGPVKMVVTIVKRKDLPKVTGIIRSVAPRVFMAIEDMRSTEAGVFPSTTNAPEDVLTRRKAK